MTREDMKFGTVSNDEIRKANKLQRTTEEASWNPRKGAPDEREDVDLIGKEAYLEGDIYK